MKIRIISSKDEIERIENEEIVHLAFRPSNKDVFLLVQRCENLKVIHIPVSYKKTISNSISMFLEMQDIKLIEGDVWGHRKDINEYYEINPKVFGRINALKEDGNTDDQLISLLCLETRLSKDLIRYLVQTSI